MKELNKRYIFTTLRKESLWKEGEIDTFRYGDWELTLRKEEAIYEPFTFSVSGKKKNSNESISRRYTSIENAFLHILNRFNENVNIKNKYETLADYFA